MNKHQHRIIFNKARGQYMAVAETAKTQGKDSAGGVVGDHSHDRGGFLGIPAYRLKKLASATVTALFGLQTIVQPVMAQIVADPTAPGNQRPTVLSAPNGVPLVNIQTPSAAGVSRNTYSQFDVNGAGAILNNSRGNVQSQTGGWVQGNPWLARGEARIILNEVNSANPSQIKGYVEIAGKRAELVIANPAGIHVDGGGFINASGVTLTTGTPQLGAGGTLDSYRVERGTVSINGKGMDASLVDYTGILARAAQINAGVWAKDLTVITGQNTVAAAAGRNGAADIQSSSQGSADKPPFALDVSQLGGMYAGKITLIGTEAGVGVRNAGSIGASAGQVQLSADGLLTNSGTIGTSAAGQNVGINTHGQGLVNSGTIASQADVQMLHNGNTRNSGTINARRELQLDAGDLDNSQGTLTAARLDIAANTLTNTQGRISQTGSQDMAVQAAEVVNSAFNGKTGVMGAEPLAQGGTSVNPDAGTSPSTSPGGGASMGTPSTSTGGSITNVVTIPPETLAAGRIKVAQNIDNAGGQIVANGATDLKTMQNLVNSGTVQVRNLDAKGVLNNDAGNLSAQAIQTDLQQLSNQKGTLFSQQNLVLNTRQLDNTQGTVTTAGTLTAKVQQDVRNQGGTLAAQSDVALASQTLDNSAANGKMGLISSNTGSIDIDASQTVTNRGGVIQSVSTEADKTVHIHTAVLDNIAGTIQQSGNGTATIMASNSLDNMQGVIHTQGGLHLSTGDLRNTAGHIASVASAHIDVEKLNNRGGKLIAKEALMLKAKGDVHNQAGQILAAQQLEIHSAATLVNTEQGQIGSANDQVLIQAQQIDNQQGHITAKSELRIDSSQLDNRSGNINGGALHINVHTGQFDNSAGTLAATSGPLHIDSGRLKNAAGTIHTDQDLRIDTHGQDLQNTDAGKILASTGIKLYTAALDNAGGTIQAGGLRPATTATATPEATLADVYITGTDINNGGSGAIQASRDVRLQAQSLNNQQGQLLAGRNLDMATANKTSNVQGKLLANAAIQLQAGTLDNSSQGQITASSGTLDLVVGDDLHNRGGTIAAAQTAHIQAGNLYNQQGRVESQEGVQLAAKGLLDNQKGTIGAGQILQATVQGHANNSSGTLVGRQALSLQAQGLSNQQGIVASVDGDVYLDSMAGVDNTDGRIQANGGVTIKSQGFVNARQQLVDAAYVTGETVSIDTHGQALDNRQGSIAAQQDLTLKTGTLNNQGGLLQAGGTTVIDTQGQTLNNTQSASHASGNGGIISHATLSVQTGELQNSAGYMGANGMAVTAAHIDNTAGGILTSKAKMQLAASALHNQTGQIQALQDVNVQAHSINNDQGLIRSDSSTTVQAHTVSNRDTMGADQGVEGQDVAVSAQLLDNTGGAIRAARHTSLDSSGRIVNEHGLISAADTVSIKDSAATRTLSVGNKSGTIIADKHTAIVASHVTGDGKILSKGDVALDVTSDLLNTGEITANGNASVRTSGKLDNQAKLQAGQDLTVHAAHIHNAAGANLLSGATTALHASASLVNRGTIDGVRTQIDAPTVANIGTGTIYGNHISIAASTIHNGRESDKAATIAARQRLDLAAGTIDNRDGALLLSGDVLAIGGTLDDKRQATGQAGTVNNVSAKIESLGDMYLSAAQVNNLNPTIATETYTKSITPIEEYSPQGDPQRYSGGTYNRNSSAKDQWSAYYYTADGRTLEANIWNIWQYNRTVTSTKVKEGSSKPGEITVGGNLTLAAGTHINNDKSKLIVGGILQGNPEAIVNTGLQGVESFSDSGQYTVSYTRRRWYGGKRRNRRFERTETYTAHGPQTTFAIPEFTYKTGQGATSDTAPAPQLQTAATAQAASTAGTAVATPHTQTVATATAETPTPSLASTGTLSNLPVQTSTTPALQAPARSDDKTLIRTMAPSALIPSASLYTVQPGKSTAPLIETDPRFTNYREWLSSDYMLNALGLDPAHMQKRLGDGFYEQRLLQEQVAQLTGRRYLGDYRADDEQYKALMNAGVTFAQAHGIRPGVTLTQAQMAQLTTDIVWLVEREVTLADGSTHKVLAPQVYVQVRKGDIDGSGALLSAGQIDLKLTGDLTNSGTIAGRRVAKFDAENLHNLGGHISAQQVGISTRQDLNNVGGTIAADTALLLSAGRDLNVTSTTHTALTGENFARTGIDRIAGLYVGSPGAGTSTSGILVAQAGRDINLTAAQISNTGQQGLTFLEAGNNLHLKTLTLQSKDQHVLDANNYHKQTKTEEIGTHIQTTSDLVLTAGNQAHLRAANINAQGAVQLTAGQDIRIEEGRSTLSHDEGHKVTSKGLLSSRSTTTRDKLDQDSAIASNLSGKTVDIYAGNDLTVQGSTVTAQEGGSLMAGNNITLTAAANTRTESHLRQEKSSGLSASLMGLVLNSRQSSQSSTLDATTHTGSVASTVSGNIVVMGNTKGAALTDVDKGVVAIVGSTVRSEQGAAFVSGNHVVLDAVADTLHTTNSSSQRSTAYSPWQIAATSKGTTDTTTDTLTLQGSTIQGGQGISVTAAGILQGTAATLAAGSGKLALAGSIVDLQGGINASQSHTTNTFKKTGVDIVRDHTPGQGIAYKHRDTQDQASTTLAPTTLSGASISITSTVGHTTLAGVQVRHPDTPVALDSAGELHLQTVTTTEQTSSTGQASNLAWQRMQNQGQIDETTHYNQLGNNVEIKAARITAQMSVQDSAQALAQEPGMGWIKQLSEDPQLSAKVNWQQIQEAHDKWNYKKQGLTPAAAAVVAIVVAYFTAGAGTSLVGATGSVAADAAINAAVSTLASQATVSAINNGGDIGKVLKDLGSQENLRQVAAAIVTAGVLSQMGSTININGKPLGEITIKDGLGPLIGKNLVEGGAKAVITSAINQQSLEEALKRELVTAIVSAGTAQGAKWVGDAASQGSIDELGRAFGHAVVGCMGGAALGDNRESCIAGAVGAVAGELAAQGRGLEGLQNPGQTVQFANMVGSIGGAIVSAIMTDGQNAGLVNIAGSAASNAAQNNRILHIDEAQILEMLQKGKTDAEKNRLNAAACYLVKCAASVPVGTEHYDFLMRMQAEGAHYAQEINTLQQTGKFKNDAAFNDFLTRNNLIYTRLMGAGQAGAGAFNTASSTALTSASILGCPASGISCLGIALGGAGIYYGYNQTSDGVNKAFGTYTSNEGQRVIDSFSVSTHPGEQPLVWQTSKEVAGLGFDLFGGVIINKAAASVAHLTLSSQQAKALKNSQEVAANSAGRGVGGVAESAPNIAAPANTYPYYPRGAGAASGSLPEGYVTVSRWVSPQEAALWVENGGTAIPAAIPRNGTPQLYVTQAGAPYPPGANGTIRIDFAVPGNMLRPGNAPNNAIILQPSSSTPIYNVNIHVPNGTTLPKAGR